MAASKIGDISPAVDLILQPLLLEALVAIDGGEALGDALPADTDVTLLDAAVHRLARIGAIEPSPAGSFGCHTLTRRGRELIRLLEDLDTLAPTDEAARHNHGRNEWTEADQPTGR